jgi:hypothetical protein
MDNSKIKEMVEAAILINKLFLKGRDLPKLEDIEENYDGPCIPMDIYYSEFKKKIEK